MYTNSIIAATGALLSVVAAIPMADQHVRHHHHPAHKRDYVWVTHNEVVVETVGVTKTVWIEPGETPPVENPKPEVHHHTKAHNTQPAAYTPPAAPSSPAENTPQTYAAPPSSSTPVYVAPPAPTTPTSTYVAPPAPTTPTTTEAPAAYTPPAAPASSAAPASYGGSSGGGSGLSSGMGASGKSYSGDLTWYDVGMGACGWTNTANEAVVAISEAIFDSYSTGNPNTNPLCGKYVSITGKDGQQHKAKIVDRCPGCDQSSLDLSHDFFNTVTDNGDGRVKGMEWTMV